MILGFIIWSIVCIVLVVIGIISWNSKTPAGFYSGVKPPEVTDTVKYNHSVGILWFVYAGVFELCGVPLMFLKQNSAGFVFLILGTVFCTIAFVVAYNFILEKYRRK